MSPSEARKNATMFLKAQARIMKKYGDAPKLSGSQYRAVLGQTMKVFQSLSSKAAKRGI
jgi:hypothetical protein